MKRQLILIGFLFYSLVSNSQEINRRFGMEIVYQPNLAYRYYQYKDKSYKEMVGGILEDETPKYGYSVGTRFIFKLNSLWNCKTGILYSNKGFIHNWNFDSLEVLQEKSYIYLDIPFEFEYQLFLRDRHSINLNFGFLFNYSIKEITEEKIETENLPDEQRVIENDRNGLEYNNLSIVLGGQYFYKLNNRFSIIGEPRVDVTLFHYGEKNDNISLKFFNVGLLVGIRYEI